MRNSLLQPMPPVASTTPRRARMLMSPSLVVKTAPVIFAIVLDQLAELGLVANLDRALL